MKKFVAYRRGRVGTGPTCQFTHIKEDTGSARLTDSHLIVDLCGGTA